MFPQIIKNKKKIKIGTDEMIKQCDDLMKQLEFKSKKAVKLLPKQLVSDFYKVCRLKDIRPFYSEYFFYFIQKSTKQQMENNFAEQVQNIMLGRSYYQKIQSLLKERTEIICRTKEQMQTIEGFTIMNSGKNVPLALKSLINNLIKDCSTLEQVKKIQSVQVQKLSNLIIKLRDNLKEIAQIVISWEFKLKTFNRVSNNVSFNKMKLIYPENGINCIFLSLYDTQFIKSSFLSHQLKFLGIQYDPFLLYLDATKKTSNILEQNLIKNLKSTTQQYKKIQQYIYDSIPKKQTLQNQQKQVRNASKTSKNFHNAERSASERKKTQKKLKQDFLNIKLSNQQPQIKNKLQNSKKTINIDQIQSTYRKKRKSKNSPNKQKKLQKQLSRSQSRSLSKSLQKAKSVIFLQEREVTISQADEKKSKKSIGSLQRPRTQSNIIDLHVRSVSKIQNVYKLSNSRRQLNIKSSQSPIKIRQKQDPIKKNLKQEAVQKILNQKKQLLKELDRQKKQQQTLKKIVKQVQSRSISQNRLYEGKMQSYEKQINLLKERIKQRQNKYEKQVDNKSPNKNNKVISKVYQKARLINTQKQSQSPQKNMIDSLLFEEKNSNKLLENKIKELTKEKIKLQKLIDKQGTKATKQKQVYERKLQKYQQIINQVKNDARKIKQPEILNKKFSVVPNAIESSRHQIQKQRQDSLLKLYARKKTIGGQSVFKQQKLQKSIKKQKQKQPFKIKNQVLSPKIDKSESDLKITNNRNTIQIVYNPKKQKKSSSKPKHEQSILNGSLLKEKQRDFQNQMFKLQKQKSVLEKKLDLKMNSKSGAQIILMKKLQQSENKIDKYRQTIQKQKNTNYKYQQRMKQMRKKINQEYQLKIDRQRQKFQQQKQYLFIKLKQEKQSKLEKDKYLSKQMIFLKQMQMRQNELMNILQNQRKQREYKQQQLEQEILKKQEILQQYQIEEIKRIIQAQVRQQMNLLNTDEEYGLQNLHIPQNYQIKKQIIQKQINSMIQQNDYELQEIDQQNQKLKQLIQKIKEQQKKVISNLQADIQFTGSVNQSFVENKPDEYSRFQQDQEEGQRINRSQSAKQSPSKRTQQDLNHYQIAKAQQTDFQRNQSLVHQLKHKADLQVQRQKLNHSRYQAIQQSPTYKQRQKIENIIELYLREPHQYPSNRSIVLNKNQKQTLVEDLLVKSRKARQFQEELMELRNVQSFVPAERDDDPVTNYMLNLRQAYQNQQADSLRRALFPAINQQDRYAQNDLSFQSSEAPPPVTLHDHVKLHQEAYLDRKRSSDRNKRSNKNFMAINRMKLLQIQEEKKQKQRQMIQEEGRKKLRRIRYKSKKKQESQLQEFIEIKNELQQKQKKRQIELQKAKKGKGKQKQLNQQKSLKQSLKSVKKSISQHSDSQNEQQEVNQFLINNDNKLQQNINKQNKQNKVKQQKQIQGQANQLKQQNKNVQNNEQSSNLKQSLQRNNSLMKQSKRLKQNKQPNQTTLLKSKENTLQNEIQKQDDQNQDKKQIQKQNQDKNKQQENYSSQQFQDLQQEQQNQFLRQTNVDVRRLKKQLGQQSNKHNLKPQTNQKLNSHTQKQQQNQQLNIKQEDKDNQNQPSQNIHLILLQQQKKTLKQDLLSYQDQIRSYISSYQQFNVYQHYVVEKQLTQYINEVTQISSQEIKDLNNNKHLAKDILQAECLVILIAKDNETNLQLGIGIFHKQYQDGEYVCDFLLAHDMKNFLNLTFNFTRYIYLKDRFSHSTEYLFTINSLQDQMSKVHFAQFQAKCKRLGEVYIKGKQTNTRKYILKKHLFQQIEEDENINQTKPVRFQTKVQIHQNLMKQKNQGFVNKFNENYCSPTVMISTYLKNNPEQLQAFKRRAEENLKLRETLLTALIFEKKQFSLKNVQTKTFDTQSKLQLYKEILNEKFNIDDIQQNVQQISFKIIQSSPKKFKRCILEMNQMSEPYCFIQLNEALTQVQTSNSAQIGTFIPLVPKFKILIIPADEFLTFNSTNHDMNVFFYTKHFIKNITQVKKQTFSKVYLPEIKVGNWTFYKDLSQKLKKTVFGKQQIQIGYQSKLNNSIIYTPHHKDLVFQKPFIISVLSANVERTIEGTPIFCKLIN